MVKKMLIKGCGSHFVTKLASETAAVPSHPIISDILIVSKIACASECDVVLGQYHMLQVFVV